MESLTITEHVPLAPMTTLRLGGPARYFVRSESLDHLCQALDWADSYGVAPIFLGGGSNLVVADEGVEALVVQWCPRGRDVVELTDDKIVLQLAAGETWDDVVDFAVCCGYAGIECMSGIPGWVGAAPVQNIGAYGHEIRDVIARVGVLDLHSRIHSQWTPDQCGFGYRTSVFKRTAGRYAITDITIELRRAGDACLSYPELKAALAATVHPTLIQVREAVLKLRRRKSMLIGGGGPNDHSAGSFFVNPVVSAHVAAAAMHKIQEHVACAIPEIPHWPTNDGDVKFSAAWLIERSGFHKGYRHGNVGISSDHCLALVHHGNGTTRSLIELARLIVVRVEALFGISLTPEPVAVGFDWADAFAGHGTPLVTR